MSKRKQKTAQTVSRKQPRRTFSQKPSQRAHRQPDIDESTSQTAPERADQILSIARIQFQQTIAQTPVCTSPANLHFPDELLWRIFRTSLLYSKWTGWPALVRLDQEKRKRLLSDTTLIRTTLPDMYGGVLPSLRVLIQKMHDEIKEDYQAGILQVINGVASGLRYDKDETYDGIRRMMNINGDRPGFVYISLLQLAGCVGVKYGANQSWKVVLSDMKTMKEDPEVHHEYERYVIILWYGTVMLITMTLIINPEQSQTNGFTNHGPVPSEALLPAAPYANQRAQ